LAAHRDITTVRLRAARAAASVDRFWTGTYPAAISSETAISKSVDDGFATTTTSRASFPADCGSPGSE
jgi:hypothetical protein